MKLEDKRVQNDVPMQDSRRFFILPQSPADSGYYVYGNLHGKPANGAYQYAHPVMMTALLRIALEWQMIDNRRFGIGDISLADGVKTPDHGGHRSGLDVDVRPLRKDGREEPVTWRDHEYDHKATWTLIHLFHLFAPVVNVIFNDPDIPGLLKLPKHDDHFHVKLRG